MKLADIDTPALLVDSVIMRGNIQYMQDYANRHQVALRPHTKTHKMPHMAALQLAAGACGITVAKVGEAEVMAAHGITDIFIANEIVGDIKFRRIRALMEQADVSFGLDSIAQAKLVEAAFAGGKPAEVLIEIEVGENRSGVIEDADFLHLLAFLKTCRNIRFKGIFSHDGNSYAAPSEEACAEIFRSSQERTLHFAALAAESGMPCAVVSIGSTPSLMHNFPVLAGVTELRPGTYIFMDASQGNHIGTYDRCAVSVLTTVISKPTDTRVITDVGAKGLTMQTRSKGLCATTGLGVIKGYGTHVSAVYDEHAIIYDQAFHDAVQVGDRVEIIPNHVCPVVNLHEQAYLVEGDEVLDVIPVLCRGKLM